MHESSKSGRRLIAGLACLNLLVMAVAALSLYESRIAREQRALTSVENLSLLLEKQFADSFSKTDLVLQFIAGESKYLSSDVSKWEQELAAQRDRLQIAASLQVADAAGNVIHGLDKSRGVGPNISDRDYFVRLRDNPAAGLVISEPILERVTGEWGLALARRISRDDGSFSGVVVATLHLQHFHQLFASLKLGTAGSIGFRDAELRLIVRHPAFKGGGEIGATRIADDFKAALKANPNLGSYTAGSTSIDGVRRKHFYRRNARYGFYVNAGIAEADFLAPWHRHVMANAVLVGISLVASAILGWYLHHSWKHEQAAADDSARAKQALETLFNVVPEMIVTMSPDNELMNVNPAWEKSLGHTIQEVEGKHYESFVHSDDIPPTREAVESQIHGSAIIQYQNRCRHKDGSYRWIEWHATPAIGGVFYAVGRDITERKRAEEALRESEQRHRSILQTAMDGFWIADTQGRLLEVNETYCRMSGYTTEELLAMSVTDFEALETADESVEHKHRTIMQGDDRFETVHRRKDGSVFDVEISAQYRNVEGGRFVAFLRDITERRQTEQALRESIELLSLYISHSPIYAFIKTVTPTESRVLYASDNFQNMLGISGKDMIGKTMAELFPPEFAARITADDWSVVANGRVLQLDEDLNGCNYTTIKFPIIQGGQTLLAGYTIDITARKRLESQLLQAQKLEAIGRLAGGIAHDFRNQLAVISGCSELLLRQSLLQPGHENLAEEILKAADRGTQLTGQLLSFSRKDMLQPGVVNLGKLVADLAGPMSHLVGEDIVVSTVGGGPDCVVNIAAAQFEHAMMNLASNSRDAMPQGGELIIEIVCIEVTESLAAVLPDAHVGSYVRVTVRDSGAGMDSATQARLFEPFFTTKERGKGTGLGLSMVYGFVRQSGGFIMVDTSPGMGASFALHFPRVDALTHPVAPVSDASAAEPATNPAGETGTILVAEDQWPVRWLLTNALREVGYTVIDTVDAQEAMAAVGKAGLDIDMLITDVVMPGMSGVELARYVHERRPGIPVLFISGYGADELSRRGVDLNRAELLVKPFTHAQLAKTVRRMLKTPQGPVGE